MTLAEEGGNMGLLDSLKKATGLGLSHAEHYERAYEKGVLLGQAKYGDAASLFQTAAQKAGDAGDGALQARATANSLLYGFVATGNYAILGQLRRQLDQIQEIETIGGKTDTVPAPQLAAEVEGRILE